MCAFVSESKHPYPPVLFTRSGRMNMWKARNYDEWKLRQGGVLAAAAEEQVDKLRRGCTNANFNVQRATTKAKSNLSHYAAAIEKAVSDVESSAAVVVEEGAQAVRRASVTFVTTAEMGVESVLHAASTGVHEAESAVVDAVTVVDAAARSSLSQKLTRSSRVTESEKTCSNGAVMRLPKLSVRRSNDAQLAGRANDDKERLST